MKRVVSIQDISCLGKCSLTVALPIISAMGVETCVVPTAVLSTHTGGFSGFTFHDLTQEVAPIADHWAKEGISFDAIYTGYLGSFEQIHLVSQFFDRFGGQDTLIYVDPPWRTTAYFTLALRRSLPRKWASCAAKPMLLSPTSLRPPLCWGLTTWGTTTMKPISGIC